MSTLKLVCIFRGCIVEENVVVGGGTSIAANSFVSHSVIGRNCKIGNTVQCLYNAMFGIHGQYKVNCFLKGRFYKRIIGK